MRLINTSTFQLDEFQGEEIPAYAILSHTWGKEEVSFQDFQKPTRAKMAGYSKIQRSCELAACHKYKFIWIDTCCIDKTSSAELSEAINSMFRWYREAEVCYAYLSDVPHGRKNPEAMKSAFRNSRWFTRAWTLQELLAPEKVKFYDHEWCKIGDKSNLRELISSVTYIEDKFLAGVQISTASVAKRMSWASKREATRAEDWAYSLMGMFGVQMPMLYGEGGPNAFLRLQRKILKMSDDESIFAWTTGPLFRPGLLAPSPAAFAGSWDIIRASWDHTRPPYSMTNKGLRIELKLIEGACASQTGRSSFLAPLNCAREIAKKSKDGTHRGYDYVFQAICLEGHDPNLWRVMSHKLLTLDAPGIPLGKLEPITKVVYVHQHGPSS